MSTHHTIEDQLASRRGFLKRAGLGLGVLATTSALSACDSDREPVGGGVGDVRGRILNDLGEPVEGVSVTLDGVGTTTTDAEGFYLFEDVTARGEVYNVTVSSAAYAIFGDLTGEVNVLNGSVSTKNFTLGTLTLDFSNDVGVLNYAYALEQLEAAFYAGAVASDAFGEFSPEEQDILRDLAAHEGIHRDFLKAAITAAGGMPIIDLRFEFSDPDDAADLGVFADRATILATAQTFEDLGVGAYNGAGRYIDSDVYLTIAGKIVSVEARHASVISGILEPNTIAGAGVIDDAALDQALAPADVLAAANPFIFGSLLAANA